MAGASWTEAEVQAAVRGYFKLLRAQDEGKKVNKAALYRELAEAFHRSPKAFELKFQNISAILYEERHPFVDGLLPRGNYQNLLKLMVWDHLKRSAAPKMMPWEILVDRLRKLHAKGFLPVQRTGSGRFGLALEHHLGIPPNSSKSADFMGIELKTKNGSTLQTLFSRVPSRFVGCKDRAALLQRYGRQDDKRNRLSLYTSFGSKPDAFGFRLQDAGTCIQVRNGSAAVLEYDYEDLEESLLSKHAETAYISVATQNGACSFPEVLYCKGPSILRFLKLLRDGKVNLDFMLSAKDGKVKDHGFLWRVDPGALRDLYIMDSKLIDLRS